MNSDDPKFTAHVLGEIEDLTAAECAEIEALLASDPAAAAEAVETRGLAARLHAELSAEAAAGLEEGQRAAVLRAAASVASTAKVVPFPRWTTALAAIAASLVVGVTAALVYRDLREAAVGNLPLADNVSIPLVVSPAGSAQQVQVGNITVAESGDDRAFASSVETPSTPPLGAVALNDASRNNGATIVNAGTWNVASSTFVSTTATLNYPVNQRIAYQAGVSGFETGTGRLGRQNLTVITSTIQTTASGSLSSYTGSTVTIGSINANLAIDHPVTELATRDRGEGLPAAAGGERMGFIEPIARKDSAGTVFGFVNSNSSSLETNMENVFQNAREKPVTIFAMDVGTASYAIVRRSLEGHQRPPPDAVRIEQLLNYFTYDYPPPQDDAAFSATMEVAECPWAPEHRLVRIGVKGRENTGTPAAIARDVKAEVEFNLEQVGAYRLIGYEGRLGAKTDLRLVRKEAEEIAAGHVATALYEVVPAGKELPPLAMLDKATSQPERELIREKDVEQLSVPMSRKPGVQAPASSAATPARVPLEPATAAPAPMPTGKAALQSATAKLLIIPAPEPEAPAAIPQLLPPHEPKPLPPAAPAPRDAEPELLPPHVPSPESALRLEPKQNPVAPYLLEQKLGEKIITPGAAAMPALAGHELLTLRLRYKAADGARKLLLFPLVDPGTTWEKSSPDFRFAAAVAGFGMLLRDSDYRGQATWQSVAEWAREGLDSDIKGDRTEFLRLIEKARAVAQ